MKKFSTLLFLLLPISIWAQSVAPTATEIKPLKIDDKIPAFTLPSVNSQPVDVAKLNAAKPLIIIFYRAGWCPFCNTHLSNIQDYEAEFIKLGYQIIAISTDSPEKLKETTNKLNLSYTLLSDPSCDVAKQFGIAFQAGENWVLPVPTVVVADKNGMIKFIHSNADYKVRISGEALLKVLKASK
jgi:peroxiredoxin